MTDGGIRPCLTLPQTSYRYGRWRCAVRNSRHTAATLRNPGGIDQHKLCQLVLRLLAIRARLLVHIIQRQHLAGGDLPASARATESPLIGADIQLGVEIEAFSSMSPSPYGDQWSITLSVPVITKTPFRAVVERAACAECRSARWRRW